MVEKYKEKILYLYKNGKNAKQTAIKLGLDHSGVCKAIKKWGEKKLSFSENQVNTKFFDSIDSEIQAYFLGWIASDGWVTHNTIGIKVLDKEIPILFKKFTYKNPNAKIKLIDGKYWRLLIGCKYGVKCLEKFGIVPNKTTKVIFPINILDKELMRHFIRGYFEGDGSIYKRLLNGRKIYTYKIEISSKNFILTTDMKNYLTHCGIECYVKLNGSIFKIIIDKNESKINFINYIYDNSSYKLTRKYLRCLEAKNEIQKRLNWRTSKFKGVSKYKNKWLARKRIDGFDCRIGIFNDENSANEAFQTVILEKR